MGEILKAIEEGKKIRLVRTWTGMHVIGDRYFNNINILVEVNGKTILDEDYPSDRFDEDEVIERFNEIVNGVYEKAYDKTHVHARAWMEAGWEVESVDFERKTVVFKAILIEMMEMEEVINIPPITLK